MQAILLHAKGNSGIGQLIAIIVAVYLAADVLSALLGLLITLIEITLITLAAVAVLGLTIWAIRARHRRDTITPGRAIPLTRCAPAALPANLRAISGQPPALTRPAPALTSQHEHAIRHFTDVITSCDDPAAVETLIRVLPDTTPNPPRTDRHRGIPFRPRRHATPARRPRTPEGHT